MLLRRSLGLLSVMNSVYLSVDSFFMMYPAKSPFSLKIMPSGQARHVMSSGVFLSIAVIFAFRLLSEGLW